MCVYENSIYFIEEGLTVAVNNNMQLLSMLQEGNRLINYVGSYITACVAYLHCFSCFVKFYFIRMLHVIYLKFI